MIDSRRWRSAAGGRALRRAVRPTAALLGAFAMVVAADGASAQRRGQGPPGPDRTEIERRIQARFGQIVQRQLGLTREEQESLVRVIRDAERSRRDLERRELELRARLRSQTTLLPTDEVRPLLPSEDARRVLDQMRELREEGLQLFRAEQEQLLQILTPPQLVRFYALREALAQRVRRLRQGPGGPGGGPPGGLEGPSGRGGR